jgi:phosphate transport system substrate-binding protein
VKAPGNDGVAATVPIATFTWLIFPEKQATEKAAIARDLVEYCLTEG